MRTALAIAALLPVLCPSPAKAAPPSGEVALVIDHAPSDVPSLGPRYAPVTMEFFVDARSSTSTWLYKQLRKLHERHPTRLRIVFRFPYTDAFSNAARAAFRRGQFRRMAEALYGGRFRRRDEIEKIARELGLDWKRFSAQMQAGYQAELATRDRFYARRWNLRQLSSSQPGLLVNGVAYRGRARSLDALEESYDQAYQHAEEVLARGVSLQRLYRVLLAEAMVSEPLALPIGSIDGGPITDEEREHHPALAGPLDFDLAHVDGPADAPVTLSVFCSLQSAPCSRLYRATREIRQAFPTETRVAFFHAYDPGDESQPSARLLHLAALCADRQGDFWSFLERVYRTVPRGEVPATYVLELGASIGLDREQMSTCLQQEAVQKRLDRAREARSRARVTRTPTVVVGGLAYLGSRDFFQLERLVEVELTGGMLTRFLWPNADSGRWDALDH